MSRLIDKGLEKLTTVLLKMGGLSEKTLMIAIEGFMRGENRSEEVRELSDMLVMMTVSVEDKAFELMVKYQPVASDLRIINTYMKIAYDFERFGRYAYDIAFTQRRFSTSQKCSYSGDLMEEIAENVLDIVHCSIKALKTNDGEIVKSIAGTENEIDKIYSDYMSKLQEAPPGTKCVISTVLMIRYLERIADHAAYVGEKIYYIATGQKILLR